MNPRNPAHHPPGRPPQRAGAPPHPPRSVHLLRDPLHRLSWRRLPASAVPAAPRSRLLEPWPSALPSRPRPRLFPHAACEPLVRSFPPLPTPTAARLLYLPASLAAVRHPNPWPPTTTPPAPCTQPACHLAPLTSHARSLSWLPNLLSHVASDPPRSRAVHTRRLVTSPPRHPRSEKEARVEFLSEDRVHDSVVLFSGATGITTREPRKFCSFSSMAISYVHYLQAPNASFGFQNICSKDGSWFCNHRKRSRGLAMAVVKNSEKHYSLESKVKILLDSVKWDEKGLAVAIAQNVDTGAILMQGFASKDALATTILSRQATFYSRSRSSLWTKGETSMNFINIHDIFLDCDRDSIIYLGKPDGPTCHTGSKTCYYSSAFDFLDQTQGGGSRLALTSLYSLESTVAQRKAELSSPQAVKPSWTKQLLLDEKLLCAKIREEADELCRTVEEDRSRTASEMADLLYHALVMLVVKDVKVEEVFQVLRERSSQSGIEEKRSRKAQG